MPNNINDSLEINKVLSPTGFLSVDCDIPGEDEPNSCSKKSR